MACENFAAKRAPLQKEASPAKPFRSQKDHATKLRFRCETSLPILNHFATTSPTPCETPLRHTCAILQPKSPFRSCEMSRETLQSQISQPQASLTKNFIDAKPPLSTRVPFCSPQSPFRNYGMSCETPCEIPIWLQNPSLAVKWPSSCENPNHHLNTKLNL